MDAYFCHVCTCALMNMYSAKLSKNEPDFPVKMKYKKGKKFGPKTGMKTMTKSRKELRKEGRKNKKAKRLQHCLLKAGKCDNSGKNHPKSVAGDVTVKDENHVEEIKNEKKGKKRRNEKEIGELTLELKNNEVKLKKEMENVRRERLTAENEMEDKNIRKFEKLLKVRKKTSIPASFRADGLDYILEVCETNRAGKIDENDESGKGSSGIDEKLGGDGLTLTDEEVSGSDEEFDQKQLSDCDMNEEASEPDEHMDHDELSDFDEEMNEEETGICDDEEDSEKEDEKETGICDDEEDSEKEDEKETEDDATGAEHTDQENGSEEDEKTKSELESKGNGNKFPKGVWEDIYGRLRNKDGSLYEEKEPKTGNSGNKYVPPALRQSQSSVVVSSSLLKSLKGCFNKLSEGNMHNISKEIEKLYMEHSRHEMNETIRNLMTSSLVVSFKMSDRILLEHCMLLAILHANIGTEIGAYFIHNFVSSFHKLYNETEDIESNKELENLFSIICYMYHFKIVDCVLIYDILKLMSEEFSDKDVTLILGVLRTIGFRLRKDDPSTLKGLILLIQKKASSLKDPSTKTKFMLDVLLAIKNNNMTKIPNYDPSYGDHLSKILKYFLPKGNYVSQLKISLQDLLNVETKGKWWIVGSAWSNDLSNDPSTLKPKQDNEVFSINSVDSGLKQKLLKKAKALGLNTETRKDIFFILMTAEDYIDAFEKLNHLSLKRNQDRDIIHVCTYCCLREKKFNPYYTLIVSRFCALDRKYMLTLQYNVWDRIKELNGDEANKNRNLAKLISHMIIEKVLPLSCLKIIDFAEMDKTKLAFVNNILSDVLLEDDVENMESIFMKCGMSEKLNLFRESLRLFMLHFMLKADVTTADGTKITLNSDPKVIEVLRGRIEMAERAMNAGKSRVLL